MTEEHTDLNESKFKLVHSQNSFDNDLLMNDHSSSINLENLKSNFVFESKHKKKIKNYLMDLTKEEIKNEEERLSDWLYGPQILIAKSREEYYKFITSRKHAVIRLNNLVEFEQKYSKEDKYFEQVKYFKGKLESMGEFSIRKLLNFFYHKKYL